MNFLDAVRAMKEGKKVRRKTCDVEDVLSIDDTNNFLIQSVIKKNVLQRHSISMIEFEATDWEVVDEDEDWNLEDNQIVDYEFYPAQEPYFLEEDVEKCRDLLTEDFGKKTHWSFAEIVRTLHRRFGDL